MGGSLEHLQVDAGAVQVVAKANRWAAEERERQWHGGSPESPHRKRAGGAYPAGASLFLGKEGLTSSGLVPGFIKGSRPGLP